MLFLVLSLPLEMTLLAPRGFASRLWRTSLPRSLAWPKEGQISVETSLVDKRLALNVVDLNLCQHMAVLLPPGMFTPCLFTKRRPSSWSANARERKMNFLRSHAVLLFAVHCDNESCCSPGPRERSVRWQWRNDLIHIMFRQVMSRERRTFTI